MENYVVTISRQFGSMGRPIAKKLSEILGIEYYDRYILGQAAVEMDATTKEIAEVEETAPARLRNMKFPFTPGNTEMQDSVFEVEKKIILDLADKESCIIVGRCSDYILRNHKNLLSVFIYAPYYYRLTNSIDRFGFSPQEAERVIDETDAAREAFNLHYAKTSLTDIQTKNLLIDSSVLGVEGTAELLADIVHRRYANKE